MSKFAWPDLGEVVESVRLLAEGTPGHVYEMNGGQCTYVRAEDGGLVPDCIVGHAFASLGVPLEVLAEVDGEKGKAVDGVIREKYSLDSALSEEGWWLRNVQEAQDKAFPWGEAVKQADKFAGKVFGR